MRKNCKGCAEKLRKPNIKCELCKEVFCINCIELFCQKCHIGYGCFLCKDLLVHPNLCTFNNDYINYCTNHLHSSPDDKVVCVNMICTCHVKNVHEE